MAEKRRYQIRVAEMLEKCVLAETYRRVLECGFRVTVLEDDEGSTRFDTGFFCKHRMCPACAWRKSMGTAVVLTAISGAMVADGYTPLMVTLTAPNCEADQLDDEILRYNHAWDKL
ncbi:protein rep, partial [uncultured Alistipes sp.]|uniref:protein rep n=1 Tax=uncultured Alistipes sp. TaxID=538949 RepID=UPI00321F9678